MKKQFKQVDKKLNRLERITRIKKFESTSSLKIILM